MTEMEEKEIINAQTEDAGNKNDCGCEGDCCPPKKKNIFSKVLFVVILMAALGIIAVKLFHQPFPATNKQTQCPPRSASSGDTAKTATCDTTKGSSCCPKK
jgi:hypothetical protein